MDSPLRMCIACREMKEKRSLLRIVKGENGICIDRTFKAAGRGAYVCKCADCINKAVKRKLLNKALKCEVPDELYVAMEEAVRAN